MLLQTLETYCQAASSYEQEAGEWPEKVLAQKTSLKNRLETLEEDSRLFEEKGLKRSSYELRQEALPILQTLIQNSKGEEKETFENKFQELQKSITLFETSVDQNRLTEIAPSLSFEEFKIREKKRRDIFFKNNCASEGENHLYLDQFYQHLLQSNHPIERLIAGLFD